MNGRWSLFALAFVLGTSSVASADQPADTQSQIQALQQQLDAVKAQLDQLKAQQEAQAKAAAAAPKSPMPPNTTPVLVRNSDPLTFLIGKEAVTFYGNLDLSFDDTTKGLQNFYPVSNDSPVGNVGWMTAVSTNLSYIGIRGSHTLSKNLYVPYQLETQIDVSSTSGTANTNNSDDSTVKGGLTSRNSYIGLGTKYAGAIKVGKTDAPYKTSTARMNPFSGELGDYSVIMGNTGGDNRAEFMTRLDHSIWYESPVMNGATVNLLVAPGQNRAADNSNIPAGESSCAGGNSPGSGALPPACNDGSWGLAYSGSAQYQRGRFYVTGAYEMHKKVNRSSDLGVPATDPLAIADVADEDARKVGAQYLLGTGTTISGIYEDMRRYVPEFLMYQNERQRTGTWFAVTQAFTKKDNLNFGWAHANGTPGDPGQHNTVGGANADNAANMYTIAFKHAIDNHFSWYVDTAYTANHADAHYDLGAGGRGVTTDCHDASTEAAFDPTTGTVTGNGPHCYAGGQLRGVSAGIDLKF
jgi:predicted porin